MNIRSWASMLVLTLSGPAALAAGQACSGVHLEWIRLRQGEAFYQTSENRVVSFQFVPGMTGKPVLIFLPGVNRGLSQNDPVLQNLAKDGFGILRTTTSDHWESLKGLDPAEAKARSRSSETTNETYARETEMLARQLGIEDPFGISLSYSSAMLSQMKMKQIFVAPLVKASDTDPSTAASMRSWEAMVGLNPFFGPTLIRNARDTGYRNYWTAVVDGNLKSNPKAYGENFDRALAIESYMQLSRVTEDFNLVGAKFQAGKSVSFLLGEFESQVRLRGQFQAIIAASKVAPVRMILVRGAEHNVPDSQPAAYQRAIQELTLTQTEFALQVGVIDPRSDAGQIRWLGTSEIQNLFGEVLKYGDSTDSANLSGPLGL